MTKSHFFEEKTTEKKKIVIFESHHKMLQRKKSEKFNRCENEICHLHYCDLRHRLVYDITLGH